jgi:glycosyltransferase involved in cell wall biosynthesis
MTSADLERRCTKVPLTDKAAFHEDAIGVAMQFDHAVTCGGTRLKGILPAGSKQCPLVTVITAVYNGKADLADCLESVAQQDYPNLEHIVMDGSSLDGTVDLLRQYDDRIAYWQSEPDRGVYDAWNKGLREARGEWICFLGVDDMFLPGAVTAYMALAAKNPDAEYLSSRVNWVHPSGYSRTLGKPWTWREFSRYMCTAHVGSMHHRRLFDRLGVYDTSYKSAADYELLLRARGRLKTAFLPATTISMRAGGVSDGSVPLLEEKRAKVCSGGRNRLLAELEFYLANVKFYLRPMRRALRRLVPG